MAGQFTHRFQQRCPESREQGRPGGRGAGCTDDALGRLGRPHPGLFLGQRTWQKNERSRCLCGALGGRHPVQSECPGQAEDRLGRPQGCRIRGQRRSGSPTPVPLLPVPQRQAGEGLLDASTGSRSSEGRVLLCPLGLRHRSDPSPRPEPCWALGLGSGSRRGTWAPAWAPALEPQAGAELRLLGFPLCPPCPQGPRARSPAGSPSANPCPE